MTSTSYTNFATGETDGAGRAGVLVQMGPIAGPARIAVSVPTVGVEDTARYTVLPGQPSAILLTPLDTAVYAGAGAAAWVAYYALGLIAGPLGWLKTSPERPAFD